MGNIQNLIVTVITITVVNNVLFGGKLTNGSTKLDDNSGREPSVPLDVKLDYVCSIFHQLGEFIAVILALQS